jgi:hypothetical protein
MEALKKVKEVGLSLFLLGADFGLIPIGERIGWAVTRKKRLSLLLVTALLVRYSNHLRRTEYQCLARASLAGSTFHPSSLHSR